MSRLKQYANQVQEGFGYEEFQPIPNGTEVVCAIESIAWESRLNRQAKPPAQDEYVKIMYRVPENNADYGNKVIWQKLYILGRANQDANKNAGSIENGLMMLAAIDQLCAGGKWADLNHDPEDEDLARAIGKLVLVTVGINRFKNEFGEPQANNTVRMLAPVPRGERADRGASERQPRTERTARTPRGGGETEQPARRVRTPR